MTDQETTFTAPPARFVEQALAALRRSPEEIDARGRAAVEEVRKDLPWISDYEPRRTRHVHRAAELEQALRSLLAAVGVPYAAQPNTDEWNQR